MEHAQAGGMRVPNAAVALECTRLRLVAELVRWTAWPGSASKAQRAHGCEPHAQQHPIHGGNSACSGGCLHGAQPHKLRRRLVAELVRWMVTQRLIPLTVGRQAEGEDGVLGPVQTLGRLVGWSASKK